MNGLRALPMESWPPQAWLATCRRGDLAVTVRHGPGVEVADDWICEAVWDGAFARGEFDRTDIVAGSGVRRRGAVTTFVSSGSTLDRLQWLWRGGELLVSNSLPCLLEAIDGDLDPAYGNYYWDFRSVIRGLDRYKPTLATAAGDVTLTYFDNLEWDGARLTAVRKPGLGRDLSSFDRYLAFLRGSMAAVAANLRDPARAWPFRLLGTLSSGYDSSTVTALASEVGLREVLSFDRAREGGADTGEQIAQILGVTPVTVPREAWKRLEGPEAQFLAADAYGEGVHYSSAAELLGGAVLLTGFQGDTVWGKDGRYASTTLVRSDPTGLSLSEFRLRAGFIHLPVPFWGARQNPDLVRISNSPEMAPWDVPGDYSRPICRRILEDRGVPRAAFGGGKKAASVVMHNEADFLTAASMADYAAWLRAHRRAWLVHGRPPPLTSPRVDRAVTAAVNRLTRNRVVRGVGRRVGREQQLTNLRLGPTYLRRYAFPWAMRRARDAYRA